MKIARKEVKIIKIWLCISIVMLLLSGALMYLNIVLTRIEKDILLLSIKPVSSQYVIGDLKKVSIVRKEIKLASRNISDNRRALMFIAKYNRAQYSEILSCMERAYKEFNLESYGMPLECYVAQACVESKFNPDALGRDNDIGLYQIIPATAKDINKAYFKIADFEHSMLFDIELNCRFGAYYLKYIFDKGYSVGDTLEVYNKWLKGLRYTDYRNKVLNVMDRI